MAFLGFADPLSLVAIGVIAASLVYSYWKRALLTFTITVACGIIFALEVVSNDLVIFDLSLSSIFAHVSPPWTLLSFQFLHANLTHLLFNVLALLLIAPVFEERIGSLRFGVLYYLGGVIGGGAFGTAMACVVRRAGNETTLWAREPEVVEGVNRDGVNAAFLPGVKLEPGIRATGDLGEALVGPLTATGPSLSAICRSESFV